MKPWKPFLFASATAFGMIAGATIVADGRMERAHNYDDPAAPRFEGMFAPANTGTPSDDDLLVVSYNIRYAEQIDRAISDLQTIAPLPEADLLLLQEMDEDGTAVIAEALGYNYVYFPAAIHAESGQNFGTAILSRWPLRAAEKLILPHRSVGSGMNRTATRATVELDGRDVVVYSAHTETILSLPWHRLNQFGAIAQDVAGNGRCAIVGGDFNTVFSREVDWLAGTFGAAGLTHATAGVGSTITRFNIDAAADHIFARGFTVNAAGKVDTATASDHKPVWARLTLAC